MKTWNERLKQTLLCGHEVLACMDHEDLVRDAFYSDNDLSDETITRLDEVMRCDACRLVVAIVTGDLAWLESQPNIAAPGSAEHDLAATEEPHEMGALAEPDQQLSFAQNLYLQITGPASDVQSFFDEVVAGSLPELKVAIAPRESTSMFSRHVHGYEARLCGTVEFTGHVSEKFGHDHVKSLIETRFPQTCIEVKVSEDAPSP